MLKITLKWFKTLLKIVLISACVLGVMLVILGNVGGPNSEFKSSVEDFVSESTGYHARISSLNNIRFFPNIVIDFNDMILFETEKELRQIGHLGRANIVMSFWDVFRQSGHFKFIYIDNLDINPGIYSDKHLTLDLVQIEKTPDNSFYLIIKGKADKDSFEIKLPLETRGIRYQQTFNLGGPHIFSIKIGEALLTGRFEKPDQNIEIKDIYSNMGADTIIENGSLIINTKQIELKSKADMAAIEKLISHILSIFAIYNMDSPLQTDETGQKTLFDHPIVIQDHIEQ